MQPTFQFQETSLVPITEPFSPVLINPEFCKHSGIIPKDWELLKEPTYTPQMVQFSYQNGVTLTAQSNRILLTELIQEQNLGGSEIAEVAQKLVQSLPNLHYDAIGFNPLGHAVLSEESEATRQYLNQTLLAPGPWQEVGQAPVRSRITFTYTLERGQLSLTVNEAGLRNEEEKVTPVVLFSGNFSYPITGSSQPERTESLMQILSYWQSDLEQFQAIVNETFLAKVGNQPMLLPVFT